MSIGKKICWNGNHDKTETGTDLVRVRASGNQNVEDLGLEPAALSLFLHLCSHYSIESGSLSSSWKQMVMQLMGISKQIPSLLRHQHGGGLPWGWALVRRSQGRRPEPSYMLS